MPKKAAKTKKKTTRRSKKTTAKKPSSQSLNIPVLTAGVVFGILGFLLGAKLFLTPPPAQAPANNTNHLQSNLPPVNTQEKNTTICTGNLYVSNAFNLSFNCPKDFKIIESTQAITINPPQADVYSFIYITKPEVTESYWKPEVIQTLANTPMGQEWRDPSVSPNGKKGSLTRLNDTLISGQNTLVFHDPTPYEGAPLYKYLILYQGGFLYLQEMSPGYADTASASQKQLAQSLHAIISSIRLMGE